MCVIDESPVTTGLTTVRTDLHGTAKGSPERDGPCPYRSLLVPLDGSPFGEQALPIACALAQRSGAALHLAHVYVPISPEGMPVMDAALIAAGHRSDRAYLERLRRQLLRTTDLTTVSCAVLDGALIRAIMSHAAAVQADIIIMTTHGRSGLARLWLGSVAGGIIRRASLPILLLRPRADATAGAATFDRMLIPLDGSALAEQILPHALVFGALQRTAITLLRVVEPVIQASPDLPDGAMALARRAMQGCARAAQAYLEQLADRLRSTGARVHTRVRIASDVSAAILEEAQRQSVDLIAMATHGRSGIGRLLFGSVADRTVRAADIPVMLYRPVEQPVALAKD